MHTRVVRRDSKPNIYEAIWGDYRLCIYVSGHTRSVEARVVEAYECQNKKCASARHALRVYLSYIREQRVTLS